MQHIDKDSLHFLVAADFNIEPQELIESGIPDILDCAVICDPSTKPTCHLPTGAHCPCAHFSASLSNASFHLTPRCPGTCVCSFGHHVRVSRRSSCARFTRSRDSLASCSPFRHSVTLPLGSDDEIFLKTPYVSPVHPLVTPVSRR